MLTVTNFKPKESGALRGFVEVKLATCMTVRDIVLFEKDGEQWTKFPTRRWQDKAGEWREEPIILIEDRERKAAFDRAVISALAHYTGEVL